MFCFRRYKTAFIGCGQVYARSTLTTTKKKPHQNTQKQEKNNCKIYGDWKYRL